MAIPLKPTHCQSFFLLCFSAILGGNSARISEMSLSWFKQTENILALCLALILLVLHLVIIDQVDSHILDEAHYIPEANFIIDGEEPDNPEHPPLGKLIISLGIFIFGDNPFGWRIFSVVFSVAGIILFYLICQKLTTNRYIPLMAAFLFAFDNMVFVMGSVAMLDVFGFALMLAAFLFYLQKQYVSSGFTLALAVLAKLSFILGAFVIVLHWFFASGLASQIWSLIIGKRTSSDETLSEDTLSNLTEPTEPMIAITNETDQKQYEIPEAPPANSAMGIADNLGMLILKFAIPSIVTFFVLMPFLDYIAMRDFHWPWDRLDTMRDLVSSLKFSNVDHEALSHPWEWIIHPETQWFWYKPTYEANVNWNMWGLIIPGIGYATYPAIRKRDTLCLFAVLWFVFIYLIWIPIELITDRVMFRFYFYPAVGAICLALAYAFYQTLEASSNVENRTLRWGVRIPIIAFFLSHLVLFIIMSPYCDVDAPY